jgi:hypothetical protein
MHDTIKKIAVLKKDGNYFLTNPKNICSQRDFNRIYGENIFPDVLEKEWGIFEKQVKESIDNIEESCKFTGQNKEVILYFIALLAIRNPVMREYRAMHTQRSWEKTAELLANKKYFDSIIQSMKQNEIPINNNISYEDIKKFREAKEWDISISTNYHIKSEFNEIKEILPYLFKRNWLLFIALPEAGPFITSDMPVILTWKDPENIPLMQRNNPGFGCFGTRVFFPLSQNIFLCGDFEGIDTTVKVTDKYLVAKFNSGILAGAIDRLYAPSLNFNFLNDDRQLLMGRKLVKIEL